MELEGYLKFMIFEHDSLLATVFNKLIYIKVQSRRPDTAPVTLGEYGNYECPYCELWETVIELGFDNKSALSIWQIPFLLDRRALFL